MTDDPTPPPTAPADVAAAIVEARRYFVLSTADASGKPWATPVYFANEGLHRFWWVSSPESVHSGNIAQRPDISMVVFDSTVPIGGASAVYLRAQATMATGPDIDHGMAVFSARLQGHGAEAWTVERVQPPALHRLYQATVSEASVLLPNSERDIRVPLPLPRPAG